MRNHTDLLNYLAETFNLQSYLEIGIRHPENNFDKIKCKKKVGVDPEIIPELNDVIPINLFRATSDDFFDSWRRRPGDFVETMEENKFDLIFIDGLHHADQVKRDFENSLKCLTDNGFIVIHDTLPTDEKYTHVPRDSKIWFGDVWKFAVTLHDYSTPKDAPWETGVCFYTLDIDCGCTIIFKGECGSEIKLPPIPKTFDDFQRDKAIFLQIISVKDFISVMDFMAKWKNKDDRLHSTTQ